MAPTSEYLSCPRFLPSAASGNVLVRSCEMIRRHRVTLFRATYFYRYGYSVFLISVLRAFKIAKIIALCRIPEKSLISLNHRFKRHFV